MNLIELVPKKSNLADEEQRLKELEKMIWMRLEEIRAKGKGNEMVDDSSGGGHSFV